MSNNKVDMYSELCSDLVKDVITKEGATAGVIVNLATAMTITGLSTISRALAEHNNTEVLPPAIVSVALTHAIMDKPLAEVDNNDVVECLKRFKYQVTSVLEDMGEE